MNAPATKRRPVGSGPSASIPSALPSALPGSLPTAQNPSSRRAGYAPVPTSTLPSAQLPNSPVSPIPSRGVPGPVLVPRPVPSSAPVSAPTTIPTPAAGVPVLSPQELVARTARAAEAPVDLSAMKPLPTRADVTPASLNSLTPKSAASSSATARSAADLATVSADVNMSGLVASKPLEDGASPDLFLELLERRNRPAPETRAADDVAFLHDRSTLKRAANDAPMWLISLVVHLILLIILALVVVNVELKDRMMVVSEPGFSDDLVLDEVFDPDAAFETVEDVNLETTDIPEVESEVVADVPDVSAFNEETSASLTMTETSLALDAAPVGDVENLLGSLAGDDLAGRGKSKAALLAQGGGTEGSEKSVALALAWLAEHQLSNGSWSYQLNHCPSCGGKCRDSGSNGSTIAATAMGLLPFLAAGNTPTTGKYKRVVDRGLSYLLSQGKEEEGGLSFRDGPGNMYSHGLATITLCETYAMLSARDRGRFRSLEYAVQEATRYIEYCQASDGGWRYTPKQPGDTSVTGWMMMGLKSAEMAGLDVDPRSVLGCRSFLRDVVGMEDGQRYSYRSGEGESLATDSIGLLCRLYLDWRVDNPTLQAGARRLAESTRNLDNPYYNYYVSQLLHHIGGKVWNNWNYEMREKLIAAQCMDGHERGSWFPETPDGHCQSGGRLYATALNCLVLEVYYRHMPLNQKMEASEAFPLEGPGAKKDKKPSPADGVAAESVDLDANDDDFPIEDFTDPEDL